MANILVNLEHGIEVGAEDVLKFLTGSEAIVAKAEPGVIATLGVLLGAAQVALNALNAATTAPLDISVDIATLKDIKAVWPAVLAFATSLGIRL